MIESNFENQTYNTLNISDLDDHNKENSLRNVVKENEYYTPDNLSKFETVSKDSFSLMHVNIRSLNKNFEELKLLLLKVNFQFKIICVTETWCHSEDINNFQIPNYIVIHQVRKNKNVGGGVCIYIHKSLRFKQLEKLNVNTSDVESITIEILSNYGKNVLVNTCYRPPSGDVNVFKKHIKSLLHNNYTKNKIIYTVGDFNVNILE